MDRVTEMRRKRSLRNSEDSIARTCEGQRKEDSDLKREREKMKMVPGRVSGGSTEDMA